MAFRSRQQRFGILWQENVISQRALHYAMYGAIPSIDCGHEIWGG